MASLLTDPVIHSVDPKESHPDGRKIARKGKLGNVKTDERAQGILIFFETHKSNALCHRLGLARELAPSCQHNVHYRTYS